MEETRDANWQWFQQNIEQILKHVPEYRWGRMTVIGNAFCDSEKQGEVEAFFGEHINEMAGGPRNLAKILKGIDLCIAKVKHHRAEMETWLGPLQQEPAP